MALYSPVLVVWSLSGGPISDAHGANTPNKHLTIGSIAVTDEITRSLVPSARINELLGGSTRPLWPLRASQPLLAVERLVANYMRWGFERRIAEMAAWRRAIELSLTATDAAKLRSIAQSRTEPASRVERARIFLRLSGRPLVFCRGPSARTASPDRAALR